MNYELKYCISPRYEHLRTFIQQIPEVFDSQGEEIYHLRNTIKVMQAPDGTAVNVKRYHVPRGLNRLVYSLGLRKPKGKRAYEYPQTLLDNGIDTPAPIAYIEERRCRLLGYTYFVSIQCDYGHTLYEVADAPEGRYEELALQLADFAATMHEKKIMHKDFTPGNILFYCDDDGQYHFSLVDTNRMHFGPVSIHAGLYNLRRMWGPKRFSELLFRHYAEQRGADARQAVATGMEMRRKFWTTYLKKHDVPFHVEL